MVFCSVRHRKKPEHSGIDYEVTKKTVIVLRWGLPFGKYNEHP